MGHWRPWHPLDVLVRIHAAIHLHRVLSVRRPQGGPGQPARGGPRPGPLGMLGNRVLLVHVPSGVHLPNAPALARAASPPAPCAPSRSATLCPTSSPSAVSATSCTASVCPRACSRMVRPSSTPSQPSRRTCKFITCRPMLEQPDHETCCSISKPVVETLNALTTCL